jgi:hypothetical protein
MIENAGTGAPPSRLDLWLPTLLSVIAGMVDLTGFLSLGTFTAHVTGNIVVVGALIVRHNQVNPAQILAIPVFIFAVAATSLIAKAFGARGQSLMRPLLLIQFLLITCLLIFSVITKQCHYKAILRSARCKCHDSRTDCRLRNGLSVRSVTFDPAGRPFNRRHDGQLDERCAGACEFDFANRANLGE